MMKFKLNSTNTKEIGTLYIIFVIVAGLIGTSIMLVVRGNMKGVLLIIGIILLTGIIYMLRKKMEMNNIKITIWKLLEKWKWSSLREVLRDSEGDLLPEEYKNRRKRRMGGHYMTIIMVLYLASKSIMRMLHNLEFVVLPDVLVILVWFGIVYFVYLMGSELFIMAKNYRRKVKMGTYKNNQNRGMERYQDILRLGLKLGRVIGGTLVGFAGIVEVVNTIGNDLGYGKMGTKTMESAAKSMGVHKEK